MAVTHYVHPIHGICRRIGTQTRDVGDETRTYVELRVDASPSGRPALSVLLPEEEILEHVRETVEPSVAKAALAAFKDGQDSPIVTAGSWRARVARAEKAINNGDLVRLARVYRDLELRHADRGLSNTERQVADKIHDLIAGELVGALDWDIDRAVSEIASHMPIADLQVAA